MQVGLLWFDNSPDRGLAAKIADAARRYQEKFGASPNTCYVNHAALAGTALAAPVPSPLGAALRVVPSVYILPHHFWVGVEDAG